MIPLRPDRRPFALKLRPPASGTGTSAGPWLAASHPLKHQVLQQLRSSRTTLRYASSLSIAPPSAGIDINLVHSPSPSPAAHRISLSLILPIYAQPHLSLLVQLRISHGWRWPVQYVLSALSLPLARRSCTAHKEKKDRIASALAICRHSSARQPAASNRLSTCISIPDCIPRFPSSFAPESRYCLLFDCCCCCRLPNCLSVCLRPLEHNTNPYLKRVSTTTAYLFPHIHRLACSALLCCFKQTNPSLPTAHPIHLRQCLLSPLYPHSPGQAFSTPAAEAGRNLDCDTPTTYMLQTLQNREIDPLGLCSQPTCSSCTTPSRAPNSLTRSRLTSP